MLGPTRVEFLMGLDSNGRLLAVPANIRVGWKWSGKQSSLLRYGNSYCLKKFYSTGHKKFYSTIPSQVNFRDTFIKKAFGCRRYQVFFAKYEIVFLSLSFNLILSYTLGFDPHRKSAVGITFFNYIKLVCLTLANIFSLVYSFQARPKKFPTVFYSVGLITFYPKPWKCLRVKHSSFLGTTKRNNKLVCFPLANMFIFV